MECEQNRQTLATAQAIKSKRLIEMQNGEYSFTRQFKEDTPFLEYYRKMVEGRHKNPESKGNWRSCLCYLEIYCDEGRVNQQVQHYGIFLKKHSAGVRKLSFSLGLALIFFLILAIFPSVTVLMSVPLGIYCLISLFPFSMAPFCHAQ